MIPAIGATGTLLLNAASPTAPGCRQVRRVARARMASLCKRVAYIAGCICRPQVGRTCRSTHCLLSKVLLPSPVGCNLLLSPGTRYIWKSSTCTCQKQLSTAALCSTASANQAGPHLTREHACFASCPTRPIPLPKCTLASSQSGSPSLDPPVPIAPVVRGLFHRLLLPPDDPPKKLWHPDAREASTRYRQHDG